MPKPGAFGRERQQERFSPKFDRIAEVLGRDPGGLELRADPTALAPERLLVFELRGEISAFARAIQNVEGLELIDEEELAADEDDKNPVAYLMVPDARALHELESLWRRWNEGRLVYGETPWRDVFELLKNLRPWGPEDRVQAAEMSHWEEEIEGRAADDLIRLEIELVFRTAEHEAEEKEQEVRAAVVERDGQIVSRARIVDVAYHALLVDLPVRAIRRIIERVPDGIAGLDPVMHVRPQSVVTSISVDDSAEVEAIPEAYELSNPILGLLDGVPVGAHPLISQHVEIDDLFDLERATPVDQRIHGTAMASLIVHGDRNRPEAALPRRIHVIPVLGASDHFSPDQLIVDVIYRAISAMRGGDAPTSPDVLIVNLSLGNRRRPFHGHLSAWARVLDRLSYQFGILFIVSAGNHPEEFGIPAFTTSAEYENASSADRERATIQALGNVVADRRVIAPAETVNGLTVGASNDDSVAPQQRQMARVNIDPYPDITIANPSSALGPGFAQSVKPDVLLPGGREHLRVIRNHEHIDVAPARASRAAGLKVAAPPYQGRENLEGYTGGTSAAAALASRTSHRIHDALESTYGEEFTSLPHLQRAVLLKALVVHPAKWPDESASIIREVIGPSDGRMHVRQRDNIRRFLGFGFVDGDDAVACVGDRATFWATGMLQRDKVATVLVPIPVAMNGKARPHAIAATLAWFTPVRPGRKAYRAVRLKLIEPDELESLRVSAYSNQPNSNQARRGTVFTRRWVGERAPLIGNGMSLSLTVQREPDQGIHIDEAIPFGLAVTVTMPGVVEIYDEVRVRPEVALRARAR